MHISIKALLAIAFLTGSVIATAGPRDINAYLMERAAELTLARTAAPASITSSASYYLLTPDGFVQESSGSNGWHCFVERAWFTPSSSEDVQFDPRVRAPHCINDEGARTRMQEIFVTAELVIAGLDREQVAAKINAAYAAGELRLPDKLAMTYMMSGRQWLGEHIRNWKPHMMLWIPHLTEDQVGKNPLMSGHALINGEPGTRDTVLVIPVPEFID